MEAVGCHCASKLYKGAPQARFYRGKRRAKNFGNFLELHFFFEAEREDLAVGCGQIGERSRQLSGAFAFENAVEGKNFAGWEAIGEGFGIGTP